MLRSFFFVRSRSSFGHFLPLLRATGGCPALTARWPGTIREVTSSLRTQACDSVLECGAAVRRAVTMISCMGSGPRKRELLPRCSVIHDGSSAAGEVAGLFRWPSSPEVLSSFLFHTLSQTLSEAALLAVCGRPHLPSVAGRTCRWPAPLRRGRDECVKHRLRSINGAPVRPRAAR